MQIELVSREITHWRSKAKLAVRGSIDRPQIGLFEEGSHRVVDMDCCPLHVPSLDAALEKIRKFLVQYKIRPYQEKEHTGRLRYLQMVAERKTGHVQLTLVFNGAKALQSNEKDFVQQLYKEGLFHSIWANYLSERTNTILGPVWELLEGQEDFFQEIHGISFAFHPSCFSQAHLSLFEEMISYIDSLIEEGRSILELYSGVGCIGIFLAARAKKIVLVESSPHAKACFEKSVGPFQDKCTFVSGKVEDLDPVLWEADAIVVDPPRKGLSRACKAKIEAAKAKQLVYVSCGYESFKRDCLELLGNGWTLHASRGFLLFPGSDHVELIADFRKI